MTDVVVWGESKMPKQQVKRAIYGGLEEPVISNQQTLREFNDLSKLMRVGALKSRFSCKKMLKLLSYLMKFDQDKLMWMLYAPRYENMFLLYNETLDRVNELHRMYSKKLLPDLMTACKKEIQQVIDDVLKWYQAILAESIRKKATNTSNLRRFMETVRIDNVLFHDNKIVSPSFFRKYYDPFLIAPPKPIRPHPLVSVQPSKARARPPMPTYPPPPPPVQVQQSKPRVLPPMPTYPPPPPPFQGQQSKPRVLPPMPTYPPPSPPIQVQPSKARARPPMPTYAPPPPPIQVQQSKARVLPPKPTYPPPPPPSLQVQQSKARVLPPKPTYPPPPPPVQVQQQKMDSILPSKYTPLPIIPQQQFVQQQNKSVTTPQQQVAQQQNKPPSFLQDIKSSSRKLKPVLSIPKKTPEPSLLDSIHNVRLRSVNQQQKKRPVIEQRPGILSDIKKGVLLRKVSQQQKNKPKRKQLTQFQKKILQYRKSLGHQDEDEQQQQQDDQWK